MEQLVVFLDVSGEEQKARLSECEMVPVISPKRPVAWIRGEMHNITERRRHNPPSPHQHNHGPHRVSQITAYTRLRIPARLSPRASLYSVLHRAGHGRGQLLCLVLALGRLLLLACWAAVVGGRYRQTAATRSSPFQDSSQHVAVAVAVAVSHPSNPVATTLGKLQVMRSPSP